MKITKIITHDGIFHADELLAIALIQHVYNHPIPVERTRNISEEDITNPEVWIVDVGGVFDMSVSCFDHHHNEYLPAACLLVLDFLYMTNKISSQFYEELVNAYTAVSVIDTTGYNGSEGFSFNSLIKSFNYIDEGFEVALNVARNYVQACSNTADKATESRSIWLAGEKISLYIRACDAFPIHWKRYEEEPLLIYPNAGKYNLLSINSEDFPLVSTGKEEFMHKNKFLAVFTTKEDAISCAQQTAYNVVG